MIYKKNFIFGRLAFQTKNVHGGAAATADAPPPPCRRGSSFVRKKFQKFINLHRIWTLMYAVL